MSEFVKTLGENMVERLIVALLAAVITTYVMTQRHEGRISMLEREAVKAQMHADEDIKRWSLIEQKMERIATSVEFHTKECN